MNHSEKLNQHCYYKSNITPPKKYLLKGIKMTPIPMVGLSNTGYTPLIHIIDLKTGDIEAIIKSKRKYMATDKAISETFTKKIVLSGDVFMKFNHFSTISRLEPEFQLFKLYFHTSFISNEVVFKLKELDALDTDDPLSLNHKNLYSSKFTVTILLEEYTDSSPVNSTGLTLLPLPDIGNFSITSPRYIEMSPVPPAAVKEIDLSSSPSSTGDLGKSGSMDFFKNKFGLFSSTKEEVTPSEPEEEAKPRSPKPPTESDSTVPSPDTAKKLDFPE